eukprot:COSAG05_NODE_4540_length_1471_cov_1.437318_1_plen_46_part_00
MGDPTEAWKTMCEIWHGLGISAERIIQDIDRWATAVKAIVEAEGV